MRKLKRVLLVDDEDVCSLVAIEIIENLSIAEETLIASNGKEALKHVMFTSKPIDIIFLDLNMPLMNGFEFLHQLYSKIPTWREHFKIIILTGSINDTDLENLRSTPVDGLIVKPLTPAKVVEVLDIVIGKEETIQH